MKKVVRLTESELVELINHVIEEGWLKDKIEDIKDNMMFYSGIGLLALYGVVSGVQIYQKAQDASNKEYYQNVLKPSLKLQDKNSLHKLSQQVGEKDIVMYIQQHPDEFVVSENGQIFWSH